MMMMKSLLAIAQKYFDYNALHAIPLIMHNAKGKRIWIFLGLQLVLIYLTSKRRQMLLFQLQGLCLKVSDFLNARVLYSNLVSNLFRKTIRSSMLSQTGHKMNEVSQSRQLLSDKNLLQSNCNWYVISFQRVYSEQSSPPKTPFSKIGMLLLPRLPRNAIELLLFFDQHCTTAAII